MGKDKKMLTEGINNSIPNSSKLEIVGSNQTNEVIKDIKTPPPTDQEKKEETNLAEEFKNLKELVNKLLTENEKLKKAPRITLAEAQKLIEEKEKIEGDIKLFNLQIEKMQKAFDEIEKIDDYQNFETLQLKMVFHNTIDKTKSTIFSITNAAVIKTTLTGVIDKSVEKTNRLKRRLVEIETLE